jgi:hypothetical protein
LLQGKAHADTQIQKYTDRWHSDLIGLIRLMIIKLKSDEKGANVRRGG